MRCPRHDLAIAADGKCVRCRREEEAAEEAARPAAATRAPAIAGLLFLATIGGAGTLWALRPARAPAAVAPSSASPAYAAPSAPPLAPLDPATVAPDKAAPPAGSGALTPLDRAMHTAQITLYSRPTSPESGLARTWLLARGYTFKERNLDADVEGREAWQKAIPDGAVPGFDIDGQAFGGFDPERLQAAIAYAGARRLQRR